MRRFVILAAPRTGSNLLCTLLHSHPAVTCHHEIFNPRGVFLALDQRTDDFVLPALQQRDRDPLAFLEQFWNTETDPDAPVALGFKWTAGQNESVRESVVADTNVLKIVLYRRNRVKAFVSTKIAQQTDQWEVYDEQELIAPRPRVHVDSEALKRHVSEYERFYAKLSRQLCESSCGSSQPWISLNYEELLDPLQQERLLQFLQVEPADFALQAASVKQNSRNLKDCVANFDELANTLAGTDLAQELHDLET